MNNNETKTIITNILLDTSDIDPKFIWEQITRDPEIKQAEDDLKATLGKLTSLFLGKGIDVGADMARAVDRGATISGMPRCYICLAIDGLDFRERYRKAEALEKIVKLRGWQAINPMKKGTPHDAPREQHIKEDIELLSRCQAMLVLNDEHLEGSNGCRLERDYATQTGIPVYFNTDDDLPQVKPSKQDKK